MKLDDLKLFPHRAGFQHKELFGNGYGISVLPEADGITYEVAVLEHHGSQFARVSTRTEIADDVIRFCTVDRVDELIERVRNLPTSNTQVDR